MLEPFTPANRRLTIALLVLGVGFAGAAADVGVSDNPPGLLLVYLASVCFVSALVHPWQEPRRYRYLAYASVLLLLLFAVLHNVFAALGGEGAGGPFRYALEPLGVASFMLAVFACPAGFVVGIVGSLVVFVRNRRRAKASAAA